MGGTWLKKGEYISSSIFLTFLLLMELLLLLLSRFSRVRLCTTPYTAAHQAPPSLGFSRQEHWSGLPFPSPRQESEKWMWSRWVVSDPQQPHGLQPYRLLHPWDFPGESTGVGCHWAGPFSKCGKGCPAIMELCLAGNFGFTVSCIFCATVVPDLLYLFLVYTLPFLI